MRRQPMKVTADICIVPLGVGVSLSGYIAACEKVRSVEKLLQES